LTEWSALAIWSAIEYFEGYMMAAAQATGTGQGALIVGMGELGGVFALAMLRRGISVVPVLRSTTAESVIARCSDPGLCVVTVGEEALPAVLDGWLRRFCDRWVLVQNELRPSDWERRGLPAPTVAVVWFEKKPGRDVRALVSTPVFGPQATIVVNALSALGLSAHVEIDPERLVFEMALKNLYILSMNSAGLVHGTDVGTLWHEHRAFVEQICEEIIDIESAQMQRILPASSLKIELERIIAADPRHDAKGRSARNRLARTVSAAQKVGLRTPVLDEILRRAEEG
jgi:ketopantoate reductase